jgi:hypothetical protein
MRHKLRFGEMATESRAARISRRRCSICAVILRPALGRRTSLGFRFAADTASGPSDVRSRRGSQFTNHQLALGAAEGSLLTNHNEFLIDTLPIRIARKSFVSIIGARSNRHSPESLKLHQNWTDFDNRGSNSEVAKAHFRAGVRQRRTQKSRKLELAISEAGAGGAEVLSQSCHVRAVRADAAGIHGKPKALGLLDAQAGIIEFREAVAFSRQNAVAPGKINRSRRAIRAVPFSNYVEELVPVTTVPHGFLPNLPTRSIGCSIGKIGSKEFRISCLVLAWPLFRQFESVILTPALQKVAVRTAHVSIKLSAFTCDASRSRRDERALHEPPYGCYTFRKLQPEQSATPSAKIEPEFKSRPLTVHVSSEKSQ